MRREAQSLARGEAAGPALVLSEPMFLSLLLPTLMVTDKASEDGQLSRAVVAGLLRS